VRSGFAARNAQVYLPPAWFRDTKRQFPVLLLLHGTPGFPEDWVRGGLADVTADKFAAAHDGNAPIIVMPDINGSVTGDSECVDSPRGNVETYLNVDVRNFVVDRFDSATQPDKWAVAGLSEGGNCALMLTLRRPDLYRTFGDYAGLSGPRPGESDADTAGAIQILFGGSQQRFDEHEPSVLLQQKKFPGVGGWFEVASDDREPLLAAEKLAPLAQRAGVDTCLVVLPGGSHTFGVFSRSFRDSLPWMAARLGLVPRAPAQTGACRPA
jgi:S-formylglutathione hydrolase FrmB